MKRFVVLKLVLAISPIVLVLAFSMLVVGRSAQENEDIDSLVLFGLFTVGPAAVIFWYSFMKYLVGTTRKGVNKYGFAVLFFLGGFVSPLFYWGSRLFNDKDAQED